MLRWGETKGAIVSGTADEERVDTAREPEPPSLYWAWGNVKPGRGKETPGGRRTGAEEKN